MIVLDEHLTDARLETAISHWYKGKIAFIRYCIICFALELKRYNEIPNLLRRVLSLAPFKTKNNKMGTVIRVTKHTVNYYRCKDSRIYTFSI